jgi:hypothetical protein
VLPRAAAPHRGVVISPPKYRLGFIQYCGPRRAAIDFRRLERADSCT